MSLFFTGPRWEIFRPNFKLCIKAVNKRIGSHTPYYQSWMRPNTGWLARPIGVAARPTGGAVIKGGTPDYITEEKSNEINLLVSPTTLTPRCKFAKKNPSCRREKPPCPCLPMQKRIFLALRAGFMLQLCILENAAGYDVFTSSSVYH